MPDGAYDNKRETPGYNELRYEALLTHDPYDQWGWVMGEAFALCDAVYVYWGVTLPEYRPGPGVTFAAVLQDYRGGSILSLLSDGVADYEDVLRWFKVLTRFANWLKMAGKDY